MRYLIYAIIIHAAVFLTFCASAEGHQKCRKDAVGNYVCFGKAGEPPVRCRKTAFGNLICR